jgi:hypothetical protein
MVDSKTKGFYNHFSLPIDNVPIFYFYAVQSSVLFLILQLAKTNLKVCHRLFGSLLNHAEIGCAIGKLDQKDQVCYQG